MNYCLLHPFLPIDNAATLHVLWMLLVLVYPYWRPTWFPYHCLFVVFRLAIVVSTLLPITASYYSFGICKLVFARNILDKSEYSAICIYGFRSDDRTVVAGVFILHLHILFYYTGQCHITWSQFCFHHLIKLNPRISDILCNISCLFHTTHDVTMFNCISHA
jgi:hypothetical protein